MSVIFPTIDTNSLNELIEATNFSFKRDDYQRIKQYLPKRAYQIVTDRLIKKLGKKSGINKSKVSNIIAGICDDNYGVWSEINDLAVAGMAERIATLEKASRAEHLSAQIQVMQALAEGKSVTIEGKSVQTKAMTAMMRIAKVVPI